MAIDTTKLRPYKNSSIPTIDGGMNKYLSTEFQSIAASTKQLVDTLTATAAEADANVTAITTVASAVTANSTAITTLQGSRASSTQFGLAKVDGTTITAVGGVISAVPTGVAPTPIKASLAADVALNNIANYFDGPSVAQGTVGTWWVSGTVTITDTASVAGIICKLWDGTTVIASTEISTPATSFQVSVTLSGWITSPAGNLRISCKDISTTSGKILFNASGNSKDSTISAYRIA